MPFSPVIPLSGLGGWRFLERTQDNQQKLFNNSPDIQREVDYFKANIETVTSASDLVTDRRLLSVALGAFGLSDEIDKQAFVRKILDEGTFDSKSFANRLGNTNYIKFAETFSFGNEGGFVLTTNRINDITDKFLTTQFEESIGDVDNSMRLALNFKREMAELASQNLPQDTAWFRAMGSLPVRAVLESAFNLPSGFSQIGLDQQKNILIDKTKQFYSSSSVDVFSDPNIMDDMIRRFHLREQINNGPDASTPGMAALSMLQNGIGSGGIGAASILNLLLSNT